MSTNLFKASMFSLSLWALVPFAGGAYASVTEGEKEFVQVQVTLPPEDQSQTEIQLLNNNVHTADVQELQAEDSSIEGFYNLDSNHFDGLDKEGREKFTSTKVNMVRECGNIVLQGLAVVDFLSNTSDVAQKLEKGQITPDAVDTVANEIDKTTERTKSIANSATLVAARAGYYIDKVTPVLASWGNVWYSYMPTFSGAPVEDDSSNVDAIVSEFVEDEFGSDLGDPDL